MANNYRKLITSLGLISLLLMPVFAQDAASSEDVSSPAEETSSSDYIIVVTADKVEQNLDDTVESVQVLTKEEIEQSGAHTLSEALNSIPGLSYTGRSIGSSEPFQMNGFSDEYVKILVDGIAIAAGDSSDVLSQISMYNVEQIEVMYGSSSALYGSDAIAGVINIITKKTGENTLNFTIGQEAGSNGQFTGDAGISYRGDVFRTEASVGYNYNSGNYEDAVYPDTGEEYREYSIAQSLKYNVRGLMGWQFAEGSDISISGNYASTELEDFKSTDNKPSYYNRNYDSLSGTMNFNVALGQRQSIGGFFSARNYNTVSKDKYFDGSYDDESSTVFGDYEAEIRYQNDLSASHNLLAGINTIYSTYEDADDNYSSLYTSLFAQDMMSFGRLQLIPGARMMISIPVDDSEMAEDEELSFNLTPKLSARFDVNDTVILRASAGMGYRVPTFTQKYNSFWKAYGNPDLRPETSYTATLGTDIKPVKGLTLTANGYFTYLEDMIERVRYDEEDGSWYRIYENIGEVISTGYNLQGNYNSGNWNTSLSYNYLFMRSIEEGELVELTGKVPHQVKGSVAYTIPCSKTTYSLNATWYAPSVRNVDEETKSPDYLIANIRVEQPLLEDRLSIYGGVKNLLNNFSFTNGEDDESMEDAFGTSDGVVVYVGARYQY